MTEAQSTKPNVEYIREWLADYKASFGVAIPSAGLPTSHVIGNVEWLLAENESLKAQLEERNNGGTGYLYVPKAAYEVVRAERDQALEVVREYRERKGRYDHGRDCQGPAACGVVDDDRCSTCIKADALLKKEEA